MTNNIALQDYKYPPKPVGGVPTTLRMGEVVTVGDNWVDIRPLLSRASKMFVPYPEGYVPTIGDRVLYADLNGDEHTPVVVAPFVVAQSPTSVPSGTAGGDLSGSYPNPGVDGLRGRAVAATAPSSGQPLVWNGSAWSPTTLAASQVTNAMATTNNLSDVASRLSALINLGFAFGSSSVTFSSSASATTTVTGIPFTPTGAIATAQGILGTATCHTDTFASGQFRTLMTLAASASLTVNFSWVAFH